MAFAPRSGSGTRGRNLGRPVLLSSRCFFSIFLHVVAEGALGSLVLDLLLHGDARDLGPFRHGSIPSGSVRQINHSPRVERRRTETARGLHPEREKKSPGST